MSLGRSENKNFGLSCRVSENDKKIRGEREVAKIRSGLY